MKNKLLTKVSNIDDISVSVEYFKDKYYPDILKEVDLLESLVEQIKEEPRILYDENYVKGWKDELTIERESIVKIVINLLQSVLNELESAHTLLSSKKNFDRWSEAKNWLKAIFEAASSGSLSKLVYYGPNADKSPTIPPPKEITQSDLLKLFLSSHSIILFAIFKFFIFSLTDIL